MNFSIKELIFITSLLCVVTCTVTWCITSLMDDRSIVYHGHAHWGFSDYGTTVMIWNTTNCTPKNK